MTESLGLRQRLEQRLKALQTEFEAGQTMLADLEAQRANLRDALLRLSGAITVLKEELDVAAGDDRPDPAGEAADAERPG